MKMKNTFITIFSICAVAMLLSCNGKYEAGEQNDDGEKLVTSISVMTRARNAAQGIDVDSENDDAPIEIDGFQDGDRLYISQMGPSSGPYFEGDEAISPYFHVYKYYRNDAATWEEEDNFKPENSAIDWDEVKAIGSIGNAFSMYAMYFPVENKVRFNVEADQSRIDNFKKSDIMGAYHATSSLYTRLRFRLFHLMTYLKVTLYVPVYSDKVVNEEQSYSGFDEDAKPKAYVSNAYTNFGIEWRANKSSDIDPPKVQKTANTTKITMYTHNYDSNYKECINVSSFYSGTVLGVCGCKEDQVCLSDKCECDNCSNGSSTECGCDEVRVYNFSVLFPEQTFGDDFLYFELKNPDGELKYYYFSGSQIKGDSGNYGLTQGTLQQLYLYLPRTENKTILVGAKILPWVDSVTEMTVTKEPDNTDKQSDKE